MSKIHSIDLIQLSNDIKAWGRTLGFQDVGICDIDLSKHEKPLREWLDKGYHGSMHFMESHGMKRARPDELVPGTLRVISVRMNYLPPDASFASHLNDPDIGYISRYALGRDYHKVLRKKLKQLGEKIAHAIANSDIEHQYRPFVDSAPVLEHALAEKAGIGWTGKHSLTLNKDAGSWFFLGELFTNLPLPIDAPAEPACGTCNACMTMCPTNAIVAPYTVHAKRCISYLTIELDDDIPEALRPLMGNRIYGCDDCQLVCPWNRYADITEESDFYPRQVLHGKRLIDLFAWSEATFLRHTEGSPIRRIGYEKWQRNIAVALGNAPYSSEIVDALQQALKKVSDRVDRHIQWAIAQQLARKSNLGKDTPLRQQDRLIRIVQKGLPRDA